MDKNSFWQEVIEMVKHHRPKPQAIEKLPKEQMVQLESNVYNHIDTLFSEDASDTAISKDASAVNNRPSQPSRSIKTLLSDFFANSWAQPAALAFAAIAFVSVGALTLNMIKHSNTKSFFNVPDVVAAANVDNHIEIPQQQSRALIATSASDQSRAFLAGVTGAGLDLLADTESSTAQELANWYQQISTNDQATDTSTTIKSVRSSIEQYSSDEYTSSWFEQGYAVEVVNLAAKRSMTDLDMSILQSALGFYHEHATQPWLDNNTNVAEQYIQNHEYLLNSDASQLSTPEQVQEIITYTQNMKLLIQ